MKNLLNIKNKAFRKIFIIYILVLVIGGSFVYFAAYKFDRSIDKFTVIYSLESKSPVIVNEEGQVIFGTDESKAMLADEHYKEDVAILRYDSFMENIMFFGILGLLLICIFIWIYEKEHNKNQKKLKHLAYMDPLTGLANYNGFDQNLQKIFKDNPQGTMVVFGVDRLNTINQIYGPENGDKIIKEISQMIENQFESNKIGRIGGNEFAFFLNTLDKDEIEEIIQNIEESIKLFDYGYEIHLSFGVNIIENQRYINNSTRLLADHCQIARGTIKEKINTNIAYYTDELNQKIKFEKEIETEMERSLLQKEFVINLQPKYNIKTEEIVGAEALIRWMHPKIGKIENHKFMPIFENLGFIELLDKYVFTQVCQLQKECIEQGINPVPISVNISRYNASNPNIAKELKSILNSFDLDINLIQIEILEGSAEETEAELISTIKGFKTQGFIVAIDDFGAGHSSLNMLKNVEADIVKLDRLFFTKGKDIEKTQSIIKNAINLCDEIGLEVVAEGIETKEQLEILQSTRCKIVQGYYFFKPLEVIGFKNLLKNDKIS